MSLSPCVYTALYVVLVVIQFTVALQISSSLPDKPDSEAAAESLVVLGQLPAYTLMDLRTVTDAWGG